MPHPSASLGAWALVLGAVAGLPAGAAETQFTGTAFVALRRVNKVEGEGRTLARQTFEALVDTCNQQRMGFYELPPLRPPDDVLARLDEQRIEHYFELGNAATHVHGAMLTLPDLERWTRELGAGSKPERPPNCAAAEIHDEHKATLWIDGTKFEVNYVQRRVRAVPAGADFKPRPLLSDRDFDAAPLNLFDGQGCREVAGPALAFIDGKACLWMAFPPVRWLNFPWALQAERRLGLPGKLVTTDTLIAVERNRAIPADKLRVPKEFK